jgi:RNA polymerase sigma-70 factor, ECF subfamily
VAPPPAGERPELDTVYRDYLDFVWRNARRLGCEDDWADDAVHEVFLVVARRLGDFEGRSSLRTWLFAIVYRVVQRMRRDRATYARRLREYAVERRGEPRVVPQTRDDAARLLRGLLSRLDEPKRLVFILAELEGFTTAEIAEAIGLRPGTIDSRLRAARIELGRMARRAEASERSGP